jgi:hypothetical protein
VVSSKDDRKKVFKKNESIVSRKIADEMLLVPVRGELADMQKIFSLNPVAEHVWECLDGTLDFKDICNKIVDSFDVEQKQAETDVFEFIDDLLAADLIVEVD